MTIILELGGSKGEEDILVEIMLYDEDAAMIENCRVVRDVSSTNLAYICSSMLLSN